MRVATLNVNGIRAAVRRGFADWLAERGCDIVALQEVRCPVAELPLEVFGDYQLSYSQGNLPGRNGVALLTRQSPLAVREGFDRTFALEGRYLEIDLPGLRVASVYVPKGGSPKEGAEEEARFHRKLAFLKSFKGFLTRSRLEAARQGSQFLVMGDVNIAHTPADLRNWRSNQSTAGFLPQERAWLGSVLGPRTLVDVVRRVHPEAEGPYSWWSWRGQAFARDTGWRIDYQLASAALAARARTAVVDKEASYEERLSDHAAVVIDYDD